MLPIKYLKVKKLVLCFSFYVKLSIILNSLRINFLKILRKINWT